MNDEAIYQREKMLSLHDQLLQVERERENGKTGISVEELDAILAETIEKAAKHAQKRRQG